MKHDSMDTVRAIASWLNRHAAKSDRARVSGADQITAEPDPKKFKATLAKVHARDEFLQRHPMATERRPPKLVGMRSAKVMAPIFARSDPLNASMSQLMLAGGVYGLMLMDIAWLRAHPETPDLYKAGVTYKPERRRESGGRVSEYGEEWQTIPWVIYRGYGDCEDLAAWRAAELRVKYNIKANPFIKIRRMPDGYWRAHVVARWPNGQIEDPSAKLGMYTFTY